MDFVRNSIKGLDSHLEINKSDPHLGAHTRISSKHIKIQMRSLEGAQGRERAGKFSALAGQGTPLGHRGSKDQRLKQSDYRHTI